MWGSAIEMTMGNWCLIPPRPSEGPHECDSDPLSRGSRGKHVSMAPVPQLPRLASCMACTSRISMQSQFLRFPCCKIRKASRQNNGKYLAQAWRAGLWPKPPQHGLEPRGFWRGDQDVAHAQWKASLLLCGDELHVYPETCQDINEDIWKFVLLRKHVLSKVRSLEESPQLAATWSQTLSRTEYAWMELNKLRGAKPNSSLKTLPAYCEWLWHSRNVSKWIYMGNSWLLQYSCSLRSYLLQFRHNENFKT